MNVSFKKILQDKITLWNFSSSLILLLGSVLYTGVVFFHLPPILPIYNRMPWGYARLGTRIEIFIPIGIACTFFLCNLYLTSVLYNKLPLVARLISIITFILSLCTCIFIIKIINIVL